MTLVNDHILRRNWRRSALGLTAFVLLSGTAFAAPTTLHTDHMLHVQASSLPVSTRDSDITIQIAQNKITPAEAKAIARRHVAGAKFNDISRKGNVYRVRLLKDGRVIDVLVDATTGRVLN